MKRYNTIHKFTLLALTIFLTNNILAQTIDPTVEVQRDFDGRMINIHKSKLNSNVHDSLSNFNLSFNYSIFDKPYKDLYEFSPLPSADMQGKVEEKFPVFLAKGGVSFPFSPLAEIYFQPRLKGGNILQINAFYNGFYSKLSTLTVNPENFEVIQDKEHKSFSSNTSLGAAATYGYNWKSGELQLGIEYNKGSNTYYGFLNTPTSIELPFFNEISNKEYMMENHAHNWQQVGAKFSIGSVNAKVSKVHFHYKVNIRYQNTSDKSLSDKLNENFIKVSGEFGPTFGKYNKFTVGFNSENALYSGIQGYKYGIYEIIPQYSFEKGRFKLKGGIKISGKYSGLDGTDYYHNSLFAVGDLSFEIAKNNLWVYANVDGGNCINSYSMLLKENKWLSTTADLKASSIPLLLKGGLRGQIHNKFSYNLYARYTVHKGLLQYIGNQLASPTPAYEESRLNTIYANHREFTVGGELKWNSKEFSAGTIIEYSDYTKARKSSFELGDGLKAIGYAPFKWDLYATYNYRERIWVGITSNYRGTTPGWSFEYGQVNYKSFLNLGINLQYAINRTLSVYLNGENLLNNQIQYYPQYMEKGVSFGAGLLVKL